MIAVQVGTNGDRIILRHFKAGVIVLSFIQCNPYGESGSSSATGQVFGAGRQVAKSGCIDPHQSCAVDQTVCLARCGRSCSPGNHYSLASTGVAAFLAGQMQGRAATDTCRIASIDPRDGAGKSAVG